MAALKKWLTELRDWIRRGFKRKPKRKDGDVPDDIYPLY